MHISRRSIVGLAFVVTAIATAIACERVENPNAPVVHATPSFKDRAPTFATNNSALVKEIEARIRATTRRGLTAQEVALTRDQRAKWKWVGVMHHRAMQEGIRDRSIKGLNSASARCAARAQYGMKYAATPGSPLTDAQRAAIVRTVNEHFDSCLTVPAGRIFSLHSAGALPSEEQIRADTLSGRFVDYTYALGNQLGNARSLQDANNIVNGFLVTVNNDPSLSPVQRDALSAAASVAASSAAEWDSHYLGGSGGSESNELIMNMFIWGWLSELGKYVGEIVRGDVYGCGIGMIGLVVTMADTHLSLTLPEFGQGLVFACGAGAITGSIMAAF